ncbi:hypothetical protein CLOM_g19359 [Closterium sp. NIES-68]|nr:hypothetical protein CLOM_g19359 [Closterium sp. NIES-68]GJP76857.1 hypothetical protein CLOP_g7307 [Closterium sp. NIES-67]
MDVERLLFAGTTINRKRFKKDIDVFKVREPTTPAAQAAASPPEENDSERPDGGASGSGASGGEASGKKIDPVEHAAVLRKRHRIHVSSHLVTAPLESFQELADKFNCRRRLLRNLQEMGFEEPTPIQRQVVPLLLKRQECFACAPTGSGKTVAFLLPIVMGLKTHSPDAIRAVILVPTRELALQISRALKQLAAGTKLRARLLTKATAKCVDLKGAACDVLISTPLRLAHLVSEEKVDLSRVQHLVLDEADKLFEMGFVEQIDGIVAACTLPSLTRALFSATLPEAVEQMARSVMHDPVRIVVGDRNAAAETVQQKLVFVGTEEGKLLAMRQLLQQGVRPPVLIFVQSKERAQQLFSELSFDGLNVDVIHADRSVAQREHVVDSFREGKVWFLIATDLMGRGMDIAGVNVVVNYDCPQTTAAYIHRIGRSGRAGRPGEAVTFYTEEDEPNLRAIANVMAQSGTEVPAWMKNLPKRRLRKHKDGEKAVALPPKRAPISTHPAAQAKGVKRRKVAANKGN